MTPDTVIFSTPWNIDTWHTNVNLGHITMFNSTWNPNGFKCRQDWRSGGRAAVSASRHAIMFPSFDDIFYLYFFAQKYVCPFYIGQTLYFLFLSTGHSYIIYIICIKSIIKWWTPCAHIFRHTTVWSYSDLCFGNGSDACAKPGTHICFFNSKVSLVTKTCQ